MTKYRRIPAEILVQQDVFRHRINPLFTPDNVRDPHQVVIHNVRKMVGWQTIRLHQHLHIYLGPLDCDFTPQKVRKMTLALIRDCHANDIRLTALNLPLPFCMI